MGREGAVSAPKLKLAPQNYFPGAGAGLLSDRCSFCLFVQAFSVNTYFAPRDISVLSGRISMKLSTNSHHLSGHC